MSLLNRCYLRQNWSLLLADLLLSIDRSIKMIFAKLIKLAPHLNIRQNWPQWVAGILLLLGIIYFFVAENALHFSHDDLYWVYPVLIFTHLTSGFFLLLSLVDYIFLLPRLTSSRPWLLILGIMIPTNILAAVAVFFFLFSSFQHKGTEIFGGNWYQLAVSEHHHVCSQQEVVVYRCGILGVLCQRIFTSKQFGCSDAGYEGDLPETIAFVNDHGTNKLYLQLGDEKVLITQ